MHKTKPVQVIADIDEDIVGVVKYLNTIEGVRTEASCQGTEKGYRAYVMVTWPDDKTKERLSKEFDMELLGDNWGYVFPRPGDLNCGPKAILDGLTSKAFLDTTQHFHFAEQMSKEDIAKRLKVLLGRDATQQEIDMCHEIVNQPIELLGRLGIEY